MSNLKKIEKILIASFLICVVGIVLMIISWIALKEVNGFYGLLISAVSIVSMIISSLCIVNSKTKTA